MSIKSPFILNFFFCAFALIALSACTAGGGGDAKQPAFTNLCDPLITECLTNQPLYPVDPSTGYQPANTETPPSDGWVEALKAVRTTEYKASTGADRIGAAYAYARGTQFTGEGTTISMMVLGKIDREHADLRNQRIDGYDADADDTTANAGTCAGAGAVSGGGCGDDILGTHIAALIAGESGNGGVQGIAYNAKVKPINLYSSTGAVLIGSSAVNMGGVTVSAKRAKAIREASMMDFAECDKLVGETAKMASPHCKPVTVMLNDWHIEADNVFSGEYYLTPLNFSSASVVRPLQRINSEVTAWRDAAANTVLVFGAGDYGRNSINGVVKLYEDNTFATRAMEDDGSGNMREKEADWKTVFPTNSNLSGSYITLPDTVPEVAGKILSVIALDSNNVIHKYSNGCGDAKSFCLGAPGVAINSAIPGGGYEEMTGTGIAAAHVSGAIAVLKGAFPSLTPTQLVSIILNTADYIPLPTNDLGGDTNPVYGHGKLNLARATDPIGSMMTTLPDATALAAGITMDNSGITLPTSFGESLDGFTVGFIDDYNRAYIGNPSRITRTNAAFTLGDTIATWESPELQSIALDSNSKMQFTNYDENTDAKDTLIFTHNIPNHTVAFSYNEESKNPDLRLANNGEELHFQKIRPIANDLMQLNSTYKLGKAWNVKNAITSGEFDTGNRFNEAMANLNYTGENRNLTIGAGTLKEYGQFLGASGTGAYQLSDATQSTVTHLAISQNLPLNSSVKLKYTNFKTEVDMRYSNFAKINDLTADEYQLSFAKNKILSKHDSLNIELIQPFAVTDGNLQQNTVLGYNDQGDYNNVTQNYSLKPTNRRQQLRITWQNQLNLERKTKLFISMQYENHVNNLRDNNDSQILGGISTRF